MDFINNINSEFKSVLDSVKEEDRLGVHTLFIDIMANLYQQFLEQL